MPKERRARREGREAQSGKMKGVLRGGENMEKKF